MTGEATAPPHRTSSPLHWSGPQEQAHARTSGCIAANHKRLDAPLRDLWDAEFKVYSQWGEDGILVWLCDQLAIAKPKMVELGAGDFTECNSRFLAEYMNASVVAVDARTDILNALVGSELVWRNTIQMRCEYITPDSVAQLMRDSQEFMDGVEILSLDIDGNDYWVMEAIDLRGIRIVVVEYNPLFGHEEAVTVPRDDQFDRTTVHFSWLYYGASLRAWVHLLSLNGLRLVGTNRAGNNAFFVAADDAPSLELNLPNLDSLERFVDWRVRESRDMSGTLSFLNRRDASNLIRSMPVVDVTSGVQIPLKGVTD